MYVIIDAQGYRRFRFNDLDTKEEAEVYVRNSTETWGGNFPEDYPMTIEPFDPEKTYKLPED
jgi:hypothetical protein